MESTSSSSRRSTAITTGAYVRVTAQRDGRAPLVNYTIHLFRLGDDDRIAEIWFHNREQAPVDAFWN